MAKTRTVGRLQALFPPDEREVYRVRRGAPEELVGKPGWPAPGGYPAPWDRKCVRCGSGVTRNGMGVWAPLTLFTRTGYPATGIRAHVIHRGCVPVFAARVCDRKRRA